MRFSKTNLMTLKSLPKLYSTDVLGIVHRESGKKALFYGECSQINIRSTVATLPQTVILLNWYGA